MFSIRLSKTVVTAVNSFLQQLNQICNIVELGLLQNTLLYHVLVDDQLTMPQIVQNWPKIFWVPVN